MKVKYSFLNKLYYSFWMLILSLIFTFINIVLVNKSGMSVSASFTTPIIFYALFKLIRLPDKTRFTSIQMFTSGSSLAMFGIEIAFSSIFIFSGNFPTYKVLIVSVLVNIFAILFSIPLMSSLEEKSYIFPKGKITANLIEMAYTAQEKGKDLVYLIVSAIFGASISLFVMLKSIFQFPLTALGLPSYIGMEISPLLFGIGMLIDVKSIITILIGMLYSIVILFINGYEGIAETFSQHQRSPYIMSIAIGLLIGGVIYTLPRVKNALWSSEKSVTQQKQSFIRINKQYFIWLAIFIILSSFIVEWLFQLSFLSWLLILILCFILSIAVIRIRAETGMGLSIAAYIFIPVIGVITRNLPVTLILSGAMVLITIQSANFLEAINVSRAIQVKEKSVMKYYLAGSIFGAITGTAMLYLISQIFILGSESFPSPSAISWGIQAELVTSGSIPESINVYFIVGAIVAGLILSKLNISASSLAMGLLLPISSVSIMCLGAISANLLKGKVNTQVISSGLITGDGLLLFINSVIILLR